jgi:hypothetical protein
MQKKVEEIANNYVNGNISDVKQAFKGMSLMEAAHTAVEVYCYLRYETESAGEAAAFKRLLAKWI